MKMKTGWRVWAALVIGWSWQIAVGAPLPEGLKDFDAYVARTLTEFEVPGIAVAIVKDGEVVMAAGFGVRKLGEPAKVDAQTVFAIASNTKAFTAAALAILVDEGKLSWDDRVADRLPGFQMADPFVTHEMRVRDLLVHRSGLSLGAGDLLYWPPSDYPTSEVVRRLRFIPLATSFRSAYAYDNILYAVAGEVVAAVSGQPWKEFVRSRIFGPVGMTAAKLSSAEVAPGDNAATGHALYDFKKLGPVAPMAWENNAPAGAIVANVTDLAKWMQVQLAGGRLPDSGDGKERRLFKVARQREMWSVVTPMPIAQRSGVMAVTQPNFNGYGLGWNLSDYRGRKVVSHTGGWPGQVSKVALVPELKVGVVVLTNQEVGGAFQAISLRVLDAYMEASPTDWVAAYREAQLKAQARADDSWAKHVEARAKDSKPSLPQARYAGVLRDVWYGDVIVAEEAGKLTLRFSHTPLLMGDMEHWQNDTFIVRWRDRSLNADAFVTFALTPDGALDQVKMEAISPLTDFSFDFQDLLLKPVAPAK